MEREMVMMFMDTLPSPYYDWLVINVASTFADLVVVGERIELGILRGKFAQVRNNTGFTKKLSSKKKESLADLPTKKKQIPLHTQHGSRWGPG
ncbi:hypothetical protein CR513_42236, partial [Mucuna pruriens]